MHACVCVKSVNLSMKRSEGGVRIRNGSRGRGVALTYVVYFDLRLRSK